MSHAESLFRADFEYELAGGSEWPLGGWLGFPYQNGRTKRPSRYEEIS